MKEVEIILVSESEKCTIYTIKFSSKDITEFEDFYKRFFQHATLNEQLQKVIRAVIHISNNGAFERYFRPEGKFNDKVAAIPIDRSKLRLYCLRLSDHILILGNGGIKKTAKYEDDADLSGYVLTLQQFEQALEEGVKKGTVIITDKQIATNVNLKI